MICLRLVHFVIQEINKLVLCNSPCIGYIKATVHELQVEFVSDELIQIKN